MSRRAKRRRVPANLDCGHQQEERNTGRTRIHRRGPFSRRRQQKAYRQLAPSWSSQGLLLDSLTPPMSHDVTVRCTRSVSKGVALNVEGLQDPLVEVPTITCRSPGGAFPSHPCLLHRLQRCPPKSTWPVTVEPTPRPLQCGYVQARDGRPAMNPPSRAANPRRGCQVRPESLPRRLGESRTFGDHWPQSMKIHVTSSSPSATRSTQLGKTRH